MKNMGKWFWAFVGVSVALVAAIVIAVVVGTPAKVPEIPEGPETGTYYFDADNGTEYLLELYDGNKFVLNDGVVRLGEYTVTETGLSFTFDKESNGTATATYADDVVTMDYLGAQIRFLRKVSYTVAFDTAGGSTVESATVVNGRPVAKPADPSKDGFVFVGWYTDAEFKTPYIFTSSIITTDATLYARFVEKAVGQVEYEITFEGAEAEAMTTLGGKVFDLPVPTKDGYTFGGWWTSDFNDAEKLTAKCEEGTAVTGNTVLYALWLENEKAPAVEIDETGIKWAAVSGVASYAVKITDPNGTVVYEQNTGTTVLTYDFAVAGQYVVEVTAGTETTTRYYNAKALSKVSVFEVIDPSTLLFNTVAGAEKYFITIKCGNPAHNHDMIDNGNSNVYNFANCEMKEGGIEFVVTATARGYASSVSTTFVYEKKLDKVTQITVDAETDTLVWTPVSSAAYYLVQVGETVERVYGNTYSLKDFSGDLEIKITPVTAGYLSPEAATHSYKKVTLQAPTGLTINGMVVSWNAVEGATGYNVKVGSKVIAATGTTLDLADADVEFMTGEVVRISVMATGATNSQYSDELVTYNQAFNDALLYKNGYVYWTPVVGSGNYEVKINGGNSFVVSNDVKAPITFTKAGLHTVAVRFASKAYTSEWVTIDIMVYSVTFDVRQGVATAQLFVAADDLLTLPTTTRSGYTFDGWYTTPSAAAGNGKLFDDETFGAKDNLVLYANWIANKYDIVFDIDEGITGVVHGDKTEVTFNQKFTLPVPSSEEGTFLGWFSGPGGSGYQVADAAGASVKNYNVAGNTTVYPFFEIGTLTYVMQPDGTYAVKQGPNIRKVFDVIIPETYEGIPVTAVLENAFKSCQYIKTISIPNTVTLVGSGAFAGCKALEAVNVRVVEGNHEVFYSSHDGALIRNDLGTTYLEYFPRSKSGEYTIPEGVDAILNKAFQYAYNLEVLNIGTDVTYIAEQAFFHCYKLREINFVEGGTKALEIEDGAFLDVAKLTRIKLPARLSRINGTATLNACKALVSITAEAGGEHFGAVDGMLTNGDCDTILYCPPMRQGALEIPVGIIAIGDDAFANRTELTSLVVPNWVESIGANAFAGCTMLRSVEFLGGRNNDLTIGDNAFAGNKVLSSVTFAGGTNRDLGEVTIGNAAFENCDKLLTLVMNDNANIVAIGASAFAGTSLSELRIAATIMEVGDSAFANCAKMTTVAFAENCGDIEFGTAVFTGCSIRSVNLPSTIKNFNGGVFQGCDTIAEIKVDPANPYLESVNGVLYNKGQTELLFYPQSKTVDFAALPATLTAIGPAAFQGNANITEVVLPANITSIGANAFEGCSNITTVTVQATENVTIGAAAFSGCTALTTANIPDCVKSLGDKVFYKTALANFEMPEAVEYIGAFAFAETKLTTVSLPGTVTTIGDGAFNKCTALTTVTIADPAEGEGAPLIIGDLQEEGYTPTGAFVGCSKLTTVNLPARIKQIGARTFRSVSSITTVNIPDGAKLETIGNDAFYGLSKITAINLPEGLKTIADQAFYNCSSTNFKTLTIPSTVEYIGYRAFYSNKFTNLTFAPTPEGKVAVPLNIGNQAFYNNSVMVSVTLPARVDTFFEWLQTANGTEYPSLYQLFGSTSTSGKLVAINIEEGCAGYMSIDGVVYQKDMAGNPSILLFCPDMKTGSITVPSTVVEVAYRAFNGPTSGGTKLTEIIFEEKENWDGTPTLSLGMTSTWKTADLSSSGAVFKSSTLTRIVFPKHLKEFNAATFNSLTKSGVSIEFAEGTKPVRIGAYAFYNNTGITQLNLPPVSHLETHAFDQLTNMTTLTFGAGSTVTEIGESMLQNCSKLTAITVPASVQKIGKYGLSQSSIQTLEFEEGSQLNYLCQYSIGGKFTSFTIPEGVETIEGPLFWSADKITTVTLNSTMKSTIGANEKFLFSNLSYLETIIVPEDNPYLKMVDGAIYDKNMTTLFYVTRAAYETTDANGQLVGKKYTIPSTVTTIETYAFSRFNYDSANGKVRYPELGNTIEIPEGVVKIGDYAFYVCYSFETLTIPASVEQIGTYAFQNLRLLEIKFAAGSQLTRVGGYAFYGMPNITEIKLPDTVMFEETDYSVFYNSKALTTVDFPTASKILPSSAFANCTSLKNVILHEGLEIIGYRAFQQCTSLLTIDIPASVVEFVGWASSSQGHDGPFDDCTNLQEVNFAENSQLTKLGVGAFDGCLSLKSIVLPAGVTVLNEMVFTRCVSLEYLELNGVYTDIPENYFADNVNLKTVVLHEGIQNIGAGAFKTCSKLSSINLPEELLTIGDAAFQGTALTSVEFGPALTKIGNYAFDGCASLKTVVFDSASELTSLGDFSDVESAIFRGTTSLKSIELPSTIRTMGASVFENSGLESVELPTDLTAVSDAAFKGCVNLTYIFVPEFVSGIGASAFEGCTALVQADIAEGVESIGSAAFRGCTSMTTTNVPKTIKEITGNPYVDCSKLSNFTFDPDNAAYSFEDGVMYDAGKFTLVYYSPANTATTFTLPETVTGFADGAFNSSQLVEITLPNSMKNIPALLFSNSKKLKNITIPAGVKEIGAEAFAGCDALTTITIPADVTKLGMGVFANAKNLSEVIFANPDAAVELGDRLFEGCSSLTNFTFPTGTTSLSNYLFAGTGITEMTLPGVITSLDFEGVFAGSALTTIIFQDGTYTDDDGNVYTITGNLGDKFFYNCKNLTTVELPAGITTIGTFETAGQNSTASNSKSPLHVYANDSYAFAGCTSLETIDLIGITVIGAHAFDGCSSLVDIKFPTASNTTAERKFLVMGDYAFANCTSLEVFDMGGFSTSTAPFFWHCPWTGEDLWVNDSSTPNADGTKNSGTTKASIGSYIFAGCTNLKSATLLPITLQQIGTNLFEGCESLEEVYKINTTYFQVGATPFAGAPATATINFTNSTIPDPTNTTDGYFIAKDDNGGVVQNHEWIKNVEATIKFQYSILKGYTEDADGKVTSIKVEDHSHAFGCGGCAPLRDPAGYETLQSYLKLAAGEVVENVSLTGFIRIIDSYDVDADTATFTMFNSYFYDIPIVVDSATGIAASVSSASYPFDTGRQTTVTGTVECINGVIHFKAGATLDAKSTKNGTVTYIIGNELALIDMPKVVTGAQRIRIPTGFSLKRLLELSTQYKGYYWSADSDAVTFETVEENGETVTYMVVTPGATEQIVTITAQIKRFSGTIELTGYKTTFEIIIKP